jgi:iron complex outermembrane receptor protein
MTIRNKAVGLAVAATLGCVAQPVFAQDSTGRLDEIVVTAQKREQKLQDVPIAVSVVSGNLAESTASFNVESLRQLVPSLNIRKTNTQLNQSLFLRGIGTINFAIAAQPSVAAVLDGVVLSSAGEAFGDLYDIERIEVLRGPQGTLFGKNASAGVVNIVSKRPGRTSSGYIDAGWYDGNELRLKASVDAPVSENLRSRTTLSYGKYDGYIENISASNKGDVNGYDRFGVRTVWEYEAGDALWTFVGDVRSSDDNCCVEVIGTRPGGANGPALVSLLSGVDFAGDASRKIRQDFEMRSVEDAWGLSVQGDIPVGNNTFTTITAYREWDSAEYREGDWLDTAAAYVGNPFAKLHDFGPQTTSTFSQEFRLASSGGNTLDYVAGLYYSKTDSARYFQRDTTVCRSTTLAPDATGLAPCRSGSSVVQSQLASADFGADFSNLAAFVDGTWNLSDSWRLIAGLRWTRDELSYFHTYSFAPTPGPGIRDITDAECNRTCANGKRTIRGDNESDSVSGRFGTQFDLSEDVMAYASYARGYKGPAYNVFFNMRASNAEVIEAETADSFEVGLKSTLLDGRMLLNAAVFSAKYDDFQANNFLFLNGTLITTLTNAGKVSSKGIELEFQALPSDQLTLGGGIAYTDATVDNFFTPPGQNSTVRAGTRLPLAPEWKANLNGEYRVNFGGFTMTPGLLIAYQSKQYPDLNEPAALLIDGYTTVDLTVAFAPENERYKLTLVGRNITDENYVALKTGGGPGGVPRLMIPRDADRYFGIQARFNFGTK